MFYGAAYQKSQSAVFMLAEKGVHLQLSSEQSVLAKTGRERLFNFLGRKRPITRVRYVPILD